MLYQIFWCSKNSVEIQDVVSMSGWVSNWLSGVL